MFGRSKAGLKRSAKRRRAGAAMVEMVMILPMFSFVLVASADFSRAFHDYVTITDSARNGALFASQNPTLASPNYLSGTTSAATVDASGMKTTPTVSLASGSLGPGNNYVDVTVSNPFSTLTPYPGISSSITLTRTIRMRVQPPLTGCNESTVPSSFSSEFHEERRSMFIRPRPTRRRRGAAIVEFSLTFPVLLMVTLGTTVLCLGVSQFQTVAMLAREATRYASVRGASYQQTTGKSAATAQDIYNNAILPKASGMVPGNITYNVVWSPNNQPGSTVTVTINYEWVPTAYVGTIQMSSTSVMTVEY